MPDLELQIERLTQQLAAITQHDRESLASWQQMVVELATAKQRATAAEAEVATLRAELADAEQNSALAAEAAEIAGYEANEARQQPSDCPYPAGTPLYNLWFAGYARAGWENHAMLDSAANQKLRTELAALRAGSEV